MRYLAGVLLSVIAATHYGTGPLAQLWSDAAAAERALFYAAQGFKGAILFAVIAFLVKACELRRHVAVPVWFLCAWGALEDLQVGACRLARGIGSIPVPGPWQGVCDEFTGLPFYSIGLCIAFVAACVVEYGARRGRSARN